jgi:hypothetical protein
MVRFSLVFTICMVCAFQGLPLFGQAGTQGSMVGTVSDASGATVANASVEVTNIDTGLKQTATSDNSGNFEILAVPIGHYKIKVTSAGFKAWNLGRVDMTVGERARVVPVLQPGDVSQEITVEANAELLQTERGSVDTIIQMHQIRELPLSNRNPVVLVGLTPGMRFSSDNTGPEHGSAVQGNGVRNNQTQFQIDGMNSNAAMDQGAMAVPNVDTVAEMSVSTNSFSAEYGRDPVQVVMVTKSGTNEFHGAAWEFFQNDALNARNTFATKVPRLRFNQFGGDVGGPVLRNRTFFFVNLQHTINPNATVFNQQGTLATPTLLGGNLSSISTPIIDPATGTPFVGNVIPQNRISGASTFLSPHLLTTPTGSLVQNVPIDHNVWDGTVRVDHQITSNQRIYGRWTVQNYFDTSVGYEPDALQNIQLRQHNVALNYNYAIRPSILLTVSGGYIHSDYFSTAPGFTGKANLTDQAGIQGFPTAGREDFIGLPNVNISGYNGFGVPGFGTPEKLWSYVKTIKTNLSAVHGGHTLGFGYEFDDDSVYGNHGSGNPRGTFNFNGQYTGNAFADYLLGLTSSSNRNYPLAPFGLDHSPYSGLYAQDSWKVTPNFTITYGVRYERWWERTLKAGNGSSFDLTTGKAIAGLDSDGKVNLTQQPVAQYFGPATANLWVPASQVGVPNGLFKGNGHFAPRANLTWRPWSHRDFVIRGGFGVYYNTFIGNHAASSIVGPPYWDAEAQTFVKSSQQRWETAWPVNPQSFVQPSVSEAPLPNIQPTQTREFNFSVQTALPFQSALTVGYVGTRVHNQVNLYTHNLAPPGVYASQAIKNAALPYPAFGDVTVLDNIGKGWYDGLQMKLERRFAQGLSFTASYAFSKSIAQNAASVDNVSVPIYHPDTYYRGRSDDDRTHIFFVNAVWDVPYGRGRRYGSQLPRALDLALGGWELAAIGSYTSGAPLTATLTGDTLGNSQTNRPNVNGNPGLSNPSAAQWFNTAVFGLPGLTQFGSEGYNVIEGPSKANLDAALIKNFQVAEGKALQFRWEAFNSLNHVNLSAPTGSGLQYGTANFGRITSAGSARTMQLGLKFNF